jgi:hypothetical protein
MGVLNINKLKMHWEDFFFLMLSSNKYCDDYISKIVSDGEVEKLLKDVDKYKLVRHVH